MYTMQLHGAFGSNLFKQGTWLRNDAGYFGTAFAALQDTARPSKIDFLGSTQKRKLLSVGVLGKGPRHF